MRAISLHFNHWMEWSGRVILPPVCLDCRDIVGSSGALCGKCWSRLRFLEQPWCPIMGIPFPHEMGADFLSGEALQINPPFTRARAAVAYQGTARTMVTSLKFSDRSDLAPWMAKWMLRVAGELVDNAPLIVPVPLHRWRFLYRRYNQAAELARAIAREAGLDYWPSLLFRKRYTQQQVGLRYSERERNVRDAFSLHNRAKTILKGRRVILVDDVFTTGATVSSAARVLLRGGAVQVDVLTFARVLRDDFANGDVETI